MPDVIAIDGPAGAGKSTIARKLAHKLGYRYLDTGAMYRTVTLAAVNNKVNLNNKKDLTKLADKINIDFLPPEEDRNSHILLDGIDVTSELRKPIINENVSQIARIVGVRKAMVHMQRQIARGGKIVVDGRDIGSRVLPDADLKLFITASLEERARRRYRELKDENISFKKVKQDINRRDKIDTEREISPLIKTDDAILIDTTNLNIQEVLIHILKIIKRGE